jgi:hypothetical protein
MVDISNFDLSNCCETEWGILIHHFVVPLPLPWGRLTQSVIDSNFVAVIRLFGYR